MALTAAERQKRHRGRVKEALARAASGLTPEQIADRDAVMADPMWPTPPREMQSQMPTFMGWSRYDWSAAPEALIDHFGMRSAWEGWQAESRAMAAESAEISAALSRRADKIIAECGEPARQVMQATGMMGLFSAYEAGHFKPKARSGRRKQVSGADH